MKTAAILLLALSLRRSQPPDLAEDGDERSGSAAEEMGDAKEGGAGDEEAGAEEAVLSVELAQATGSGRRTFRDGLSEVVVEVWDARRRGGGLDEMPEVGQGGQVIECGFLGEAEGEDGGSGFRLQEGGVDSDGAIGGQTVEEAADDDGVILV
jgi:hypothetical protein